MLNVKAAANIILGSCFQHAFQMGFLDKEESKAEKLQFVNDIRQLILRFAS